MATRSTIFHITEPQLWAQAGESGSFTGSTRDKTLEDVGFIHCSYGDQVAMIADFVYPDWDDELILLEINPAGVAADLRVESAFDGSPMFPHIYGPLPTSAVTAVHALTKEGKHWKFPS